jgi:hypothetical protein
MSGGAQHAAAVSGLHPGVSEGAPPAPAGPTASLLSADALRILSRSHPELAARPWPCPSGLTARLPSGRLLGYAEYQSASQSQEQPKVVVFLPGIPGCRLFTPPGAAQGVPGWRLLVMERPGIGLSDDVPDSYTYSDFVQDFRQARAEQLKLALCVAVA